MTLFGRVFVWLGIEANARAITGLLAIGGVMGALALFLLDRVAPRISPQWSTTSFGEGYRRGQRETELEYKLLTAEDALGILRTRQEIDKKVRNMTEQEVTVALKRWFVIS